MISWSTSVPSRIQPASLTPNSEVENVSLPKDEQEEVQLSCIFTEEEQRTWGLTLHFYFQFLGDAGLRLLLMFPSSKLPVLVFVGSGGFLFLSASELWVSQELAEKRLVDLCKLHKGQSWQ